MQRSLAHDGSYGSAAGKARRIACCVMTLLLLTCVPTSTASGAGPIVLVLSSDAAPYVQAQGGLNAQLAAQHCTTRSVTLAEATQNLADLTTAPAVVAIGTSAALTLQKVLPAPTPLVYCMVADPGNSGLAQGRATYGVSTDIPLKAQFALVAEALPQTRTIGILYHADTPEGQRHLKMVQDALPGGWQLQAVAIERSDSIAGAIDELAKKHVDVIWTAPDASIYDTASVRALLLAGLRTNTPVFGFSPAFVRAGALLGIGVDPQAQGRQAAILTAALLQNPADPQRPRVAAAEHFQIAVNLIVASKLGVQLPQEFLGRATHTFKER